VRVAHGPTIRPVKHVAIIMDGNGRWATARGLERLKGHLKGVERVREIIQASPDLGITHLTLFAFSTENWKRTEKEVAGLMMLFRRFIRAESENLVERDVRVRFIGGRTRLGQRLRDQITDLEAKTEQNGLLHLTIALNYGGRDEITRAMRRMAAAVKAGTLQPDDITEDTVSGFLDTALLPDPDLVIRTSGEFRTSNFLPWQAAYSEYAFVPTNWPEFTVERLEHALETFEIRERRFGAVLSR
jgi:undecaprenyl diphosphate synthase